MKDDPIRLLTTESGASEPLRTLLRSSTIDAPSAADLERLRGTLQMRLDPSARPDDAAPGSSGSSAPASAPLPGGGALKAVVLAAGLGMLGSGLALWFGDASPPRRPTGQTSPAAAPTAAAPTPADATADAGEAAPVHPSPVAEAPAPAVAPARSTRERPRRFVSEGRNVDRPPAATAAAPPVPDEAELLGLAHRAVQSGSPEEALRLAADHERVHPAGVLIEEREAIVVEALARLGRTEEARSRLEAFLARFPESSYGWRLQALVAPVAP